LNIILLSFYNCYKKDNKIIQRDTFYYS
jgi:hypothetical protein